MGEKRLYRTHLTTSTPGAYTSTHAPSLPQAYATSDSSDAAVVSVDGARAGETSQASPRKLPAATTTRTLRAKILPGNKKCSSFINAPEPRGDGVDGAFERSGGRAVGDSEAQREGDHGRPREPAPGRRDIGFEEVRSVERDPRDQMLKLRGG
eukprot:30747-Pelagococcus_subviridis.AAC.4